MDSEDQITIEEAAIILRETVADLQPVRRSTRGRKAPDYFAPMVNAWADQARKQAGSITPAIPATLPAKRGRAQSPRVAHSTSSQTQGTSSPASATLPLPSLGNESSAMMLSATSTLGSCTPSTRSAAKKVKLSPTTPEELTTSPVVAQSPTPTPEMPAAEASELDLALENAPVGPSANDLSIETEDIPDDSTPEEDPLDVVNQAFKEGIIHPAYCPTMVHVADGKYMVPQKCLRCVETNAFCDRDYPCMRCRADDHGCGGAEGNRIMVEAGRDHAFKFIVGNLEGFHQGLKLRSTGQPGAFCTNPPLPYALKPDPVAQPEVWAEGRQALCETVPYYRSYQSSAYVKNGLAYALLVDKDCGRRDFMDGNVVITRMGGGRELQLDGTRVQAKGQRGDDSTLRSFVNSMERKSPVVVIVGKDNPTCPTKVPHAYCVLAWFHITAIWCEKVNHQDTWNFRFEKLDPETTSWWTQPAFSSHNEPPASDIKAARASCVVCRHMCPQMNAEGWMCLNEKCEAFWTIDGIEPPITLHYNMEWLRERTKWDRRIRPAFDLKPPILTADEGGESAFSLSRVCWKGVSCPFCGRCNSRSDWHGWTCETPGCTFTHTVPHQILSPRAVLGAHDFPYTGHALPIDWCLPPLKEDIRFDPNYRIHTFTIPGCGTITHFMANQTVNKRAGGPDDMFVSLQKAPLGLKRFALTNANCKGPLLTQHFAMNFGMPYKYVVDVDSKSFGEAPEVVLSALNRLTWAGEQSSTDHDFKYYNELLTLGYFEEQKIGYHDDGESTLGPSIATLSLGGQAAMRIRMKASCWNGPIRKKAYKSTLPVPPGCKNEKELTELNAKFKNATAEQWQSLVETYLNRKKDAKANPPVALELQLNHGDMVVMNGADIQKFYEHCVVPRGMLRYAMTCRFVKPELIPRDQHWKGTCPEGLMTPYDGDIQVPDVHQAPVARPFLVDRRAGATESVLAHQTNEITQAAPVEFPAQQMEVDRPTDAAGLSAVDQPIAIPDAMQVGATTEYDRGKEAAKATRADRSTEPAEAFHVDKQTSTVPHIFIDPQLVLAEPMLVDGPTEVDLPTQVNEQDHVTQPSQVYEPTSAEVDVSSPLSSPPPGFFDNGV